MIGCSDRCWGIVLPRTSGDQGVPGENHWEQPAREQRLVTPYHPRPPPPLSPFPLPALCAIWTPLPTAMGLNFSTQLDQRMRDYLKGRADILLNDIRPHCRGQNIAAILNKVWNEVEPRPSQAPQLLRNKEFRASEEVIAQGHMLQHVDTRRKWKQRYFVMKASYHLEYFETKEAEQRGLKPEDTVLLSGFVVLTSVTEYTEILQRTWPHFNGVADNYWKDQYTNCPTDHPLFLWHPYRPHLILCFHTADDLRYWSALLADGIRHLNTVLFRKDSFEVRAFLEAVRVCRMQKGQYGICDLYFGSETEILSNMVMEDLCPVLESQLLPHIRGPESKRKQTWLKMIGEMYAVVEMHVSEGFQALLRENEEQSLQLEKKIRSDFNQILTSKKQLVAKLQESLGERVRWCCEAQVRPHLESARDRLADPMNAGLEETRRLFSEEVNRVISVVKSTEQSSSSLAEVCSQLQALPYQSAHVQHCYKKTETLEQSLGELEPRFSFTGFRFLTHRAQNIIQQLLEDAVYTFQHLLVSTQPATGLSAEVSQRLDNTQVRVLKKLDSDSTAVRRQFVRDSLLEIFLPYVLKTVEPICKPELPMYEGCLCTDDDDGLIQIESTYNELVLHIVSEEINKAMKETSTQPSYSLYNESMGGLWNNEAQLGIAEDPRTSLAKVTLPASPEELPEPASAVGLLTALENSKLSEVQDEWQCLQKNLDVANQASDESKSAE
ncbi:protein Niban 1-like isoform X1 [Hemiscyllium ocellatum]|uniref:protein Niban 1-like isoform X1 n=1 Tax=Hemiscyllium ocellatum TaxID=170820 RepID=UPI0029676364|nr:protein Niban 1-like isoform X1 [Hemiscyllium ocellatum]